VTRPSTALLAGLVALAALSLAPAAASARTFADTGGRVVVFSDQIGEWLTPAQTRFVAERYAGSQKQTRSFARRMRAVQPNYLVLHYRLGTGLGYRAGGDWVRVIYRDSWVREWPTSTQDRWFYVYAGRRVYNRQWGWFLMNTDDTNWRAYWSTQVLRQVYGNEDDGLFADSYSVPNFMGGSTFSPRLPDYSPAFETAWAARLNRLSRYMCARLGGKVFIPNAGFWVTGRDRTAYSLADGIMIEGLGQWEPGSPFDESDWVLQQDRILSISRRAKIVLNQAYLYDPADAASRSMVVASHMMSKGRRGYLTMELGYEPEWFAEYTLDLGAAVDTLPASIAAFRQPSGLYRRRFAAGIAVVNPTDAPIATTAAALSGDGGAGSWAQAVFVGGGELAADANASGTRVDTVPVTELTVPAHGGVVLLKLG
jgi:hypothetical protein